MNINTSDSQGQVIYFSHGGGPLPILNDPSHGKMIQFMKDLPAQIHKPDAIIVFSAHWEEDIVSIQSSNNHEMIYDYYGFPDAAYRITYPCKGNSALAKKVGALFEKNGIEYRLDDKRPYDHGSYIPLKIMYPDAEIPVIQVSLNHNLNPLTHISMGQALRPLLTENILIIGSGFSFHNMRAFDFTGSNQEDTLNNDFQDKLIELCYETEDKKESWQYLANWTSIKGARYCHPREEHLLPLLVCAGVTDKNATKVFDDYILGKRATAFLW